MYFQQKFYDLIPAPQSFKRRANQITEGIQQLELQLADPPVEKRPAEMLRAIVCHAEATCPFWQKRLQQAGVDTKQFSPADLGRMPILEKDDLRSSIDELCSTEYHGRLNKAVTGGSTAAPMPFYQNAECTWQREVWQEAVWNRFGKSPYDRWASVWGAIADLGNVNSFRTRLWLRRHTRSLTLPGNELSHDSITQFWKQLQVFKPVLLHGYSKAIALVAAHVEKQQLQIPASLKAVSVTAEPIEPAQKRVVQTQLKVPVYEIYGTREFGYIAADHPEKDGMHTNPQSIYCEVITEEGKAAQPGELGHLIITDLLNYGMPLIRYRLGDLVRLHESSTPTTPVIAEIVGRQTDFIITRSGRHVNGATLSALYAEGFKQLQYLQHEKERVLVNYVPDSSFDAESLDKLRLQLRRYFFDEIELEFQQLDNIPLTPAGKSPIAISDVWRSEQKQ